MGKTIEFSFLIDSLENEFTQRKKSNRLKRSAYTYVSQTSFVSPLLKFKSFAPFKKFSCLVDTFSS